MSAPAMVDPTSLRILTDSQDAVTLGQLTGLEIAGGLAGHHERVVFGPHGAFQLLVDVGEVGALGVLVETIAYGVLDPVGLVVDLFDHEVLLIALLKRCHPAGGWGRRCLLEIGGQGLAVLGHSDVDHRDLLVLNVVRSRRKACRECAGSMDGGRRRYLTC